MPYHIGTSGECPNARPHAVIKDSDGEVMGCHSSRNAAERQIAAIHASEGKSQVQPTQLDATSPPVTGSYVTNITSDTAAPAVTFDQMSVGTPWEGVLAVEGVDTGDGRRFADNAITWVDPATAVVPLQRNVEDSHGGEPTTRTVLVGRIDQIWRDPERPNYIMGRGVFDDRGEHGAEALRQVREGFLRGISVDPDNIKDADVELVFPEGDGEVEDELADLFTVPELTVYHAGRLRAATLVNIPAFVEAQVWLTETAGSAAVTASIHFGTLSENVWNASTHETRLTAKMSLRVARLAYAHVATSGDGGARFLHHEVSPDGVVGDANLTACGIGIRSINTGKAVNLSDAERHNAYVHMAQHLRAAGLVPPTYVDSVTASLTADDPLVRPPAEWFEDPRLTTLTPFTVTDAGRVYGHGAEWNTCHTSYPDTCTEAPSEPNGEHAYYRVGEVVCAGGERIPVGTITLGTGHAAVRGLTPSQAAEHYDNTGTVVAVVASGEDDYGIWVAGALVPGLAKERVTALRAAALSGDWRRIGGQLRLVALLAVNHPGFPIPRLSTYVSRQKQLGLVAAGVVVQDRRQAPESPGVRAALLRLAKGIGRDPQSRLAELRRRVHGDACV